MDYLTYTEKLNYLIEMIQNERLISSKQASEKFNCSERTIRRMLQALREQGSQIKYCQKIKKYFIEN